MTFFPQLHLEQIGTPWFDRVFYVYTMMTRAKIEAARTRETESHNRKMRAFDALLSLIPEGEDKMPSDIESIFDDESAPAERNVRTPPRVPSAVEDAVRKYADLTTEEYTSATVRDALMQSNNAALPTNPDTLMNSIGVALQNLVARNYITRTYAGKGRDPHRYETNRVDTPQEEAA